MSKSHLEFYSKNNKIKKESKISKGKFLWNNMKN